MIRPVEARLVPLAFAFVYGDLLRKNSSKFLVRAVSMQHTRRALKKLSSVLSHPKGLLNRCVLSFCLAYGRRTATLYHNATRSGASIETSSRLSLPHSLASRARIASACHYSSQVQSADSPSPDKYAPQKYNLIVPIDRCFVIMKLIDFLSKKFPVGPCL